MKRLSALLLALATLMLLSFAACDSVETPSGDETSAGTSQEGNNQTTDTTHIENNGGGADTTAPDIDFNEIMSGNSTSTTIWGKQDEATKQQIIAAGKEAGVDVTFGTDGSMTVVDTNTGDTIVQKPDGTWVIRGENGEEGQIGGSWPDNEFTKLLPKPDYAVMAASTTEQQFSVSFADMTVEEVRAYAEEVKEKGFTVDAEITDQEFEGLFIYSYRAQNADGYIVTVTYTDGYCGVMVEKP